MLGVLLTGLLTGAILSLSAVALVLVYRATGVLNFAQGAVGMVGTFTMLSAAHRLPLALAILVGLPAAALLSLLIGLGALALGGHRLEATVLTLGALGAVQAAAQLVFGGHPVFVSHLLAATAARVAGASIGVDEAISAALALALCAGVVAAVRLTPVGLLARAVAGRPDVVATFGLDERPVLLVSWALAGALAALTGVLLLTAEPSPSTVTLTLIVVESFAAALVGRLVSLPGAVAGGLLVGVVAASVQARVAVPGSGEAAVFVVMILLLAAWPPRPVRSAVTATGGLA
jgi:sulfate-transporting ATPase